MITTGLAPREWYEVYKLDGITYVPHYCNTNYYVSPGFPRYTKTLYTPNELIKAGASVRKVQLFLRSNTKEVHELAKVVIR